jgi:hypothetical protein
MVVCVAGPMDAHNSETVHLNVHVAGPMDAHNNQTNVFTILLEIFGMVCTF